MQFQSERYENLIHELLPLFDRHYTEVESDQETCALDPNHDAYKQMDASGIVQITTARDDGKLVGYCFFVVSPPLHHASTQHAMLDMFYLAPEYRKGFNAIKLFKMAEDRAVRAGAKKIVCGCKVDHDIGSLFKRLGYHPDEVYFSKVV